MMLLGCAVAGSSWLGATIRELVMITGEGARPFSLSTSMTRLKIVQLSTMTDSKASLPTHAPRPYCRRDKHNFYEPLLWRAGKSISARNELGVAYPPQLPWQQARLARVVSINGSACLTLGCQ